MAESGHSAVPGHDRRRYQQNPGLGKWLDVIMSTAVRADRNVSAGDFCDAVDYRHNTDRHSTGVNNYCT